MLIFSLDADGTLAPALAADLDQALARHEDRGFEDGEHKLRPLVDPRGDDVYVVSSLHGGPAETPGSSPHDKLCRLLMFIHTLRDHGAARVTAVVPYLAYARKDRQTQPFDPVTQRWVAQLFEAVGTAQLLVLEAHNVAAFQNAFRCPTQHLSAQGAFDALVPGWVGDGPVAVASPDPGGVKRALVWRDALAQQLGRPVGFAMIDKRRAGGVLSGGQLVAGDVAGATVLLLDDLIATGHTVVRAATALRAAGARGVIALAAHGLFVAPADALLGAALADGTLDRLVVTDSVPPFRLAPGGPAARRLAVASAVPLFATAIRASHGAWLR